MSPQYVTVRATAPPGRWNAWA